MNKILNAIKKFFLSIINWVKQTAWVQPLLIVGAIFGLIMSIKPVSNFIGEITTATKESKFYDYRTCDLETIESKIDGTKDSNKVLIVIYIDEANGGNCANCKSQEKPLQQFFDLNHDELIAGREYEVAVLDIRGDEFVEDVVGEDDLKYISDHIEKYELEYTFDTIKKTNQSWVSNGEIDVSKDEPISTPCFARYEDGKCVGIKMGYSQSESKEFEKFCYYDWEQDFKEKYTKTN